MRRVSTKKSEDRVTRIVDDFVSQLEDKHDVEVNEALAVASTLYVYLLRRSGMYSLDHALRVVRDLWENGQWP